LYPWIPEYCEEFTAFWGSGDEEPRRAAISGRVRLSTPSNKSQKSHVRPIVGLLLARTVTVSWWLQYACFLLQAAKPNKAHDRSKSFPDWLGYR